MKKYILSLFIALVFSGIASAQKEEILLQWTGVVRSELNEPLPYVHLIDRRDFRFTVSDNDGRFTIITFPGDTLLVSCVGYKTAAISVPPLPADGSHHYIHDIVLQEDTIMLSEVVIFPWKTYQEFKEAFLSLELPEDDLQRAYHNIAIIEDQIYRSLANRPSSPTMNFRDVMSAYHNRQSNLGHMYPTYMITNPLAWANFIKAVKEGRFKRKDIEEKKTDQVEEYIKNNHGTD